MTRKDYKQYGWVEVSGQRSTLLTATVAGAGLAGGRGGRLGKLETLIFETGNDYVLP